jgi:hypothetical protein
VRELVDKLWKANASPLLSGARSGPVGTPDGMNDAANSMFATKRAGNFLSYGLPELA